MCSTGDDDKPDATVLTKEGTMTKEQEEEEVCRDRGHLRRIIK